MMPLATTALMRCTISGPSLIGYSNVPSVGALPWSVPFPSGTQVGDMMVIVVADTNDLAGNVAISSSGATTSKFFAAGPLAASNLAVFYDQIDSTDLSSGIEITGTPSTLCGAVFVFRGPVSTSTGSSDITNAALSNGATATLSGFTPSLVSAANLAILMTKSATFTATAMSGWQSGLVNGTNASFLWQILDGGYSGQDIEWANVQNMGAWCAISEDLYR